MELKHVLARQPGPEAAEQLQLYRHTLREKTKQLKVRDALCPWLRGCQACRTTSLVILGSKASGRFLMNSVHALVY